MSAEAQAEITVLPQEPEAPETRPMGFSFDSMPDEVGIKFSILPLNVVDVQHFFRVPLSEEMTRIFERIDSADKGVKQSEKTAARRRILCRIWADLVVRVSGYRDADELRGADLVAFFRGEIGVPQGASAWQAESWRDSLERQVLAAIQGFFQEQRARYDGAD